MHVIAFLNAAVTPIYAGMTLGKTLLGLNNWAHQTAWFPLQFVEIMRRAGFPLWARLQMDREAFADSVERTVQVCAIVTLFCSSVLFGIGPSLIHVVFTDKWMPALPALYVYAFGVGIAFLSPLIASALDAMGKPRPMTNNAILTTIVNWTIMLTVLSGRRSLLWFAAAYQLHLFFGNLLAIRHLKLLVPEVRFFRRLKAPIVTASITAALGRYGLEPHITGAATLVGAAVVIAAAFVGLMFLLDRAAVREALSMIPRKGPAG